MVDVVICVAEAVDGGVKCEPSVGHETTAETGFLAGLTVTETRVGTSDCPWVVRAPAGRRVNLTLFNFAAGAGVATSVHELSRRRSDGCPVGTGLVVFDGNRTTAVPLCSKDAARQKRVYSSQGPVLKDQYSDVSRTSSPTLRPDIR